MLGGHLIRMLVGSMVGLAVVVVNGEIGSAMWAEIPKDIIERRVGSSGSRCNKEAFCFGNCA
jgi:hypothetical protein